MASGHVGNQVEAVCELIQTAIAGGLGCRDFRRPAGQAAQDDEAPEASASSEGPSVRTVRSAGRLLQPADPLEPTRKLALRATRSHRSQAGR
jgi:hypothetical protein